MWCYFSVWVSFAHDAAILAERNNNKESTRKLQQAIDNIPSDNKTSVEGWRNEKLQNILADLKEIAAINTQ